MPTWCDVVMYTMRSDCKSVEECFSLCTQHDRYDAARVSLVLSILYHRVGSSGHVVNSRLMHPVATGMVADDHPYHPYMQVTKLECAGCLVVSALIMISINAKFEADWVLAGRSFVEPNAMLTDDYIDVSVQPLGRCAFIHWVGPAIHEEKP